MRRTCIAIAAGIALADASIVTLGLPSILVELDATVEGVALVLGVYTAVLAVALLPAAALCRRLRRRRTSGRPASLSSSPRRSGAAPRTRWACCSSSVASRHSAARAGWSPPSRSLDGGRPGPGRRMWVAASVFGIAVGPALGGALTQAFSWRAIFLAQAPIVLPGLLVALRVARTEALQTVRR